jgi:DNA polymerase I-like protein with 3'-5' exonuclease and polymerase domains
MQTLYLDIETEGLNPFDSPIVCAQVLNGKVSIFDSEDIAALKPVLESSLIVGHNLKFEQKFLKHHYGINLNYVYDTWLSEIVISGGLQAGRKGTSLKDLTQKYCNIDMSKEAQTTFRANQVLTPEQIKYAALDVQVLPIIYKAQLEQIKALRLEETIKIENNALSGVAWLELSGMPIDLNYMETLRIDYLDRKYKSQEAITQILKAGNKEQQRTLLGEQVFTINLNSPEQLKQALNNIGINVTATSESELKKHKHPVIDLILKYKNSEKLLNTFLNRASDFIDTTTGRIHGSFNQYGAHSGRFTCSKPNLQQQPNSQEWRSVYRAGLGNKIVTADYSQIELRILAEVSKDAAFIKAYETGQDLHTLTASKIFNKPLSEVSKQDRQVAKSVNFGTVYGIGAQGLAGNLETSGIKVTENETRSFIDGFYKGYPGVAKYLLNSKKTGIRNLVLRNKAGRLIKFEPPKKESDKGSIGRKSQNMPIQSLCADMVKIAISNLHKILEPQGVRFINCVHDELVFECKEDQSQYVADTIKEEMEKAGRIYLNKVPCIAEVTVSDTWDK